MHTVHAKKEPNDVVRCLVNKQIILILSPVNILHAARFSSMQQTTTLPPSPKLTVKSQTEFSPCLTAVLPNPTPPHPTPWLSFDELPLNVLVWQVTK